MKAEIVHPTKALISLEKGDDLGKLTKLLTYTNTSISFQLKKTKNNYWWKQRNPHTWAEAVRNLEKQMYPCLLYSQGSQYWVRPGILPYLPIAKENIKSNLPELSFKPLPWAKPLKFKPYNYQAEAVKRLLELHQGNISLPTGCGKSLILLLLAREMGLDTVVITPSQSIFNELLTTFQTFLGKKYVGGYGDGKKDIKKKITIAIGKSISMLKEGTDAHKFFKNKKAMLVDESHTFAAEELSRVCHDVLNDIPYRYFVSATQTRNDGTEKLLQSIIGETVLDMSLEEAIRDGYLCPLKFTILKTYSPSTQIIKDPITCKRTHFLYNENIAEIIGKIANASWNVKSQSSLILVEELRQISMLTKYLTVPYGYVHSASKGKAAEWGLEKVSSQEKVEKFNNGTIKVLIGTRAIATGTNIYPTHNTFNWVGGGSEIITKQGTMGRSTRKLEISEYKHLHSPKSHTNVYDFDVTGEPILKKQLQKRVSYYSETGEIVKIP